MPHAVLSAQVGVDGADTVKSNEGGIPWSC